MQILGCTKNLPVLDEDTDDDGDGISDVDTEPGEKRTPEIIIEDLLRMRVLDVDVDLAPRSGSVMKSVKPASIDYVPEVSPNWLEKRCFKFASGFACAGIRA